MTFSFQGGEPTLCGLGFYRKLIQLESQYRKPGVQICHTIQTNGMLIDDQWAEFFYANRFLVGLSLDGTKALHDRNRVNRANDGSWKTVVSALHILQKHHVEVNLLCVITGASARNGQSIYRYFQRLGCQYIQFIPCMDPLDAIRGKAAYSITPEQYGRFLCSIFDQWYRDWQDGNYVSIRLFDDYVHLLCGQPTSTCATTGNCGQYFVVEGDGSVFPCDFYCVDQWYMGNIREHSLRDLADSYPVKEFLRFGAGHPSRCGSCPWLTLCRGGCRRDWTEDGQNYFCEAFEHFFPYAMPRLQEIADAEMLFSKKYNLSN